MQQISGAEPTNGRALASWRRLAAGDGMTAGRFTLLVLAFSIGAALVQIAFWMSSANDYVGTDPDDTMRLVEIRDYLAGQGWFDLTQYRLGPDGGTLMHWSRLIDWPIAQLIKLYGLFLTVPQAEAAALATWPLLLIIPLFASAALAAYRLGGRSSVLIILVLSVVYLVAIVRFRPGAIDHHNVQLVLVAIIVAMLVDPLARASNFAAAALAGAVALAIGTETTPIVAAAAIAVALLWAIHGERYRRAAIGFGVAFAVSTGAIFIATTPPRLWYSVTCDTLSLGYTAMGAAGGLLLAICALLVSGRSVAIRFGALVVTGVLVLGLALSIAPQCLQNPLSNLDPLLTRYWLNGIREAQSMVAELANSPHNIGAYYAVGLLASAVCLMRILRGEQPIPHALLLGLIALSWAVSVVQVRGMLFANFLASIPLAVVIADLRAHYTARPKDMGAALAFIVAALISVPSVWGLIGVTAFKTANAMVGSADPSNNSDDAEACITAKNATNIAKLPTGRILAGFDEGPALLRFTQHSVLAANYHRNQSGMLAALKLGMLKPQDALSMLEAHHVRYVLLCDSEALYHGVVADYPDGFYAALFNNDIPGYLEQMPDAEAPGYRLYQLIQR
jgi:hypothetical protein